MLRHNQFYPPNPIFKLISSLRYFDRLLPGPKLGPEEKDWLKQLKSEGYVVLENYVNGEKLSDLQAIYQNELENKLNFEEPCLDQNLIDDIKHKEIIDNFFRYPNSKLAKEGMTFSKSDVSTYNELTSNHAPSSLKTYIPSTEAFFNQWLDEKILNVIESYLGLKPYMMEAYLRRNFPGNYKTTNHFWHRDTNNKFHLLKVFILFSDCAPENGPHEYIPTSVNDLKLNGKTYYSEEEVDHAYPEEKIKRLKSTLKAGTVIIEDTRGLHRAGLPSKGHRDLGYAIFLPLTAFSKNYPKYYSIDRETFKKLSQRQQSYIPEKFIS